MTNLSTLMIEGRKRKNLTQEELAKRLNVTRQAVSNWENDKNYPNVEILKSIAKELDLKLSDVLEIDNKALKIKHRKRLIILSIIFIIVLIVLIGMFFSILKRNKIAVYTFSIESDNVNINGGTLVLSRVKNYLAIGSITSNTIPIDNDTTIRLYQSLDSKERLIIECGYRPNLIIREDYGYSEYFDKNFRIDNVYIDIITKDNSYTYKLDFFKEFSNDGLFYFKNRAISDEEATYDIPNKSIIPENRLLNNGYTYDLDKGTYNKINNECVFNYSKDNNTLYLNCSNNDKIFDISSYISFNTLLVHLNKFNYELNAFDDICTFTKDDEIKCNKGNFDSLGNYYNLLINEYNLLVNK